MTWVERLGLVLGLALAAALMWPVRGYVTDDTFIHLQYARNLVEGHGFVFNIGERVYGSTSPLWVALLADGMALGFDGLQVAKALGFVATLASVGLFMQLMRRTLRMPELRALATIVWSAHAWMIRWSLSGMETPLAVALVLAGFVAFTEGRQWGSRPVRTGALWALAALTRPEAVFLLVLWGVFLIIDTDSREGLRRLIAGVLPPTVIYGGWLLFSRVYFGTFWPNTLAAKTAGGEGFAYFAATLWREIQVIGATDAALAGALIAALVFGIRRLVPRRLLWQRLVPPVWLGTVPVLYVMRGVPVLSRYLVPLMPVLAWLSWRAVERWWSGEQPTERDRAGARWLGLGLASLALLQNLAVYRAVVLPQVRSFSAGLRQSLEPMGRWLGENTPEGSSVAAPDIGAIGWFSRRPVVDLAGLVTPQMVPLLVRETPEETVSELRFAEFARPTFLIDRAVRENDLLGRSPYASALTPLTSASVPNLGVARPGEAVYTLYRVDWARYDTLRAGRGQAR